VYFAGNRASLSAAPQEDGKRKIQMGSVFTVVEICTYEV